MLQESGTHVLLTNDPIEAVSNANVVATDTWIRSVVPSHLSSLSLISLSLSLVQSEHRHEL